MNPVAQKEHLAWLDAMRGFTMMLVVAYHVAQFGFGENEKTSAALPFLVLFRMPLFFFVSGFLAYKKDYLWTAAHALSMGWKKLKIQVIPTVIFLCLFVVFRAKGGFWDELLVRLESPTKGGYWFTWVLLQMFILYYTCSVVGHLIQRKFRLQPWQITVAWVALWGVAVWGYETLFLPDTFTYHQAPFFQYTSIGQTIHYMQYFLLGNIVHRYWGPVQRIFDNPWFFPLLITLAVVCCADIFRWHTLQHAWTNLPKTTAKYTLLTLMLMFFRYYREWFSSQHLVGRTLQFIGQRTLDVYLLHFFTIPKMPAVGQWLNENQPNFLLSLTLSMSVGMLVIGFSLIISNVLRISPFFKLYLFGRKT